VSTIPFGTKRTRRWLPWASIAVPTIGWLVFGLFPSVATVFYSFTEYSGFPGTPLHFCGLCNYHNALNSSWTDFETSVTVTLKYVAGVTVLQISIGLGLALLLRHRRRGFGLYRALIFMPQVFSVTIVGVLFSLILDPQNGPAEPAYHGLFGSTSAFLGDQTWALWHWKPLVNGYSGYYPRDYITTIIRMEVFPENASINRLRAHGVRYVIVHRQLYEPERLENLMLRISSRPELKPWGAYQDPLGMADLFELLD